MKGSDFNMKTNERERLEAVFPFYIESGLAARQTDFCVRKNTASCVLRHSKPSLVPQNNLPLQGAEKPSEVGFSCEL